MDRVPLARPSWRKPAGIFLILALIAAWAVLVVTLFDRIGHLPWPVHAFYFLVAGIAWVLPLKPLLRWMETGRWRG
jgi:predicted membrane channel-forming protein YqfA (hemolysin III family)